MNRRRVAQPSSLTSLLDVLFILVFASIAQTAAIQAATPEAVDEAPDEPAPSADLAEAPDAGALDAPEADPDHPVAPAAGIDPAVIRARALQKAADALADRMPVQVWVTGDGVITRIAAEADEEPAAELAPTALLARDPDPDVGLVYLGDRTHDARVCSLVRAHLGVPDLRHHLIIILPRAPLRAMSVALVGGLRRDQERCLEDHLGVAVLIETVALDLEEP